MSEHLTPLDPNETAGAVFFRLYNTADELVTFLDDLRKEEYGERSGRMDVPGTPLEIGYNDYPSSSDQHYVTTIYSGGSIEQSTPLVGRTHFTSRSLHVPVPVAVSAHRGHEMMPDYVLERPESSKVVICRLAVTGLRGQTPDRRLIGTSQLKPEDRVGDLVEIDSRRLNAVAAQITRNATIVELIAGDMSLPDATAAADLARAA